MTGTTPLTSLITEAKNGNLTVRMDPEEFAKIEYECQAFKTTIVAIQANIDDVAKIQTWGFGDHGGSILTSAQTMADRFRKIANGSQGGNDFHTVLKEHWEAVEDIRLLHVAVRDRFIAEDEAFATRFNAETARLDQIPGGR
ncbi:hypothetical protein ACFWU5_28950 [Nocardia sp. NPDC058640]|uniref:hypothetical protein n=1 Tax=Nocardia sp. NPDC058640 TaxID=3346571 RepID=UPI00364C7F7B